MAAVVDDRTEQSIDEVVALAGQVSRTDEEVARLMGAAVLEAAGRLSPEDRRAALAGYDSLVITGCRPDRVLDCTFAVDAAHRLDEQPQALTVPVPEGLAAGEEGDELIYRVLALHWDAATTQAWVAVARDRGLDPLADVADTGRPASLRVWAGAARGRLYPQLGTEAEVAVQEHLAGLVGCQGVDRLVAADVAAQACDLDSTLAYYLAGTW